MGLAEYKKKRRFNVTPEPGPKEKRSELGNIFVVQKHRATQLHYDFRLEADGVLKLQLFQRVLEAEMEEERSTASVLTLPRKRREA